MSIRSGTIGVVSWKGITVSATPSPVVNASIMPSAALVGPRDDEIYHCWRSWDLSATAADAELHGFRAAMLNEIEATHAFCEKLMQMRLAPLWSLASAHNHTRGSAWIHADPGGDPTITGVWLMLPLNWDGEASLRSGRFGYATPRLDELCAPGDEISAMYLWFAGGTTRTARRAIMATTQAWLQNALCGLRIYGRAASLAGSDALAKFGFQRLAPQRSDLFILSEQRRGQ